MCKEPSPAEIKEIEAELRAEKGREVEMTPEDYGFDWREEELIEKQENNNG